MNELIRIIGFVLLIGLTLLHETTAEKNKNKIDDVKPILESSSIQHNDPSEVPLLALHEDLLGESTSSTSSLPLSMKPSSIPDKEILTTSQPLKPSLSSLSTSTSSSPSPPSSPPPPPQPLLSSSSLPNFSTKPILESTTSNLLTGEEDFENNNYSDVDDQNESNESQQPPRKLITFDQRQEGQYNIRADLDNFMIVVIPPNPTAGISLLDLLTRSSSKRTNTKKSNKKHYHYGVGSDTYDLRKSNHYPSERSKNNQQQHISYLNKILQSNQNLIGNSNGNDNQIFDFIEGRTPYRVDISSNIGSNEYNPTDKLYQNSINGITENSNSGSDTGQQIDVIPPPYPIKYQQHLMKPYHLEIEPHVVQIPLQHSTAHAIPPQVPTNIYNPSSTSSGSISQQSQQQQQQQQQQRQSQQRKQEQNQRSFLNGGGFNPASVARGNFLDFFSHFTNGIPGIPGSTSSSILLPNTNSRSFYPSISNNPTSTTYSSFNTNNNKNNNLSRRYAKSIRDSLIYYPDPDLNLIQFNNVLRGDGGNNIYNNNNNINNNLEKRDSIVIKRDIPTTTTTTIQTKNKLPTFFGISLNSNDPTLYPPISYHRIIMNPQDLYTNIDNNNNYYGIMDGNLNDYDDSIIDTQQNNIEEIIKKSDFIENNGTGFNNNIELKLIGATEQCGPDSLRDSYGVCRLISSI